MSSEKPSSRPPRSVVSISLDPAHRAALLNLSRLTGRSAQSLLREGLDFVLGRYVPVEIKAPARSAVGKDGTERRATKRVPTLTDSIHSPATSAAQAVRAAYVAESLAPNDPTATALIEATVAAAARHGFVVQERDRSSGQRRAGTRTRRAKR